jgi:hypothetical protein
MLVRIQRSHAPKNRQEQRSYVRPAAAPDEATGVSYSIDSLSAAPPPHEFQHEASSSVPSWVDEIPTFLAVGVDEFFREQDPVLLLWHGCDAAELTLRLITIAGLSELRHRELTLGTPMDGGLLRDVHQRIELPTLGLRSWRSELSGPASGVPSSKGMSASRTTNDSGCVGESGPTRLTMRVAMFCHFQLAHGGGITKARARVLLNRWRGRLADFVHALRVCTQHSVNEFELVKRADFAPPGSPASRSFSKSLMPIRTGPGSISDSGASAVDALAQRDVSDIVGRDIMKRRHLGAAGFG